MENYIGYCKDGSKNDGTDTFTINSIKIRKYDSEVYETQVIIGDEGQSTVELPGGKYSITEIEAPEGYKVSDEKIPDKLNNSLENEIKFKECTNIIKHLKNDSSYIIALDLNGKQYTSEEFSKKLDIISMVSSNITFVIGGSLGFNQELLNLCNEKICFSKMTFPHQLIRVFLLEQIFRGFKILNGETYHR